jgi:hypothetical protein
MTVDGGKSKVVIVESESERGLRGVKTFVGSQASDVVESSA